MGAMISKPDANPILFGICNLFLFGALGYFLMGQQKKAIISAIIYVIGWPVCGLSVIWIWIAAYDAYLLGQKLQSGASIGENENGLEFLNAIFKD
jgi:hypothetical protein